MAWTWFAVYLLCSTHVMASAEPHIVLKHAKLVVGREVNIPDGMFGVRDEAGGASIRARQHTVSRPFLDFGDGVDSPSSTMKLWTLFSRFQPALPLANPKGWERWLSLSAKKLKSVSNEKMMFVEFWDGAHAWEGRPWINDFGGFYDERDARQGAVVTLDGRPLDDLVWKDKIWWIKGPGHAMVDFEWSSRLRPNKPQKGKVSVEEEDLILDMREGESFRLNGESFELTQRWRVGRRQESEGMSRDQQRYLKMLSHFLDEVGASPINVAAGWGAPLDRDDYDLWRTFFIAILNQSQGRVAALTDHRKAPDVRGAVSGGELAWNYSAFHGGRSVELWTTEAGGLLNPEHRDLEFDGIPEARSPTFARGVYSHALRGILYPMVHGTAQARFHFLDLAPDYAEHQLAALELLEPLRGERMVVESSDEDLWAVASGDEKESVVVLFNDHYKSRSTRLSWGNPGLNEKQGLVEVSRMAFEGRIWIPQVEQRLWKNGVDLELGPREALVVRLKGEWAEPRQVVQRQQLPLKGFLMRAEAGIPLWVQGSCRGVGEDSKVKLRLVFDRPVSGIKAQWGRHLWTIHHTQSYIMDHPLPFRPENGPANISLTLPTHEPLLICASLMVDNEVTDSFEMGSE